MKSFQKVKIPEESALYAFDSFNDKCAVIVGQSGLVLRTEDGGATWTEVKTDTKNPLFAVETLPGTGLAWAVGHFNTILHSKDRGKTWEAQEYVMPEDAEDEPGYNAVYFLNEQTGWIVGEFGTVLRTDDGGMKWTLQASLERTPLYDVHFSNAENGVLVGASGLIATTADGGKTWAMKPAETKSHLFRLSLVGETLFAVGQEGMFVKGTLGADTNWSVAKTGIYTWLDAVLFLTAEHGYVAGGRGTLLETTDGGKTWKTLSGR